MEDVKDKVEPNQETTQAVESTQENDNGFSSLPEETQKEFKKLREENARRRIEAKGAEEELNRLRALEKEIQTQREKELAEQGKFKELLEKREKELEALKPLKELNEQYESSFKSQLEEELKGLSETMVNMINETNTNYARKLELARKIKSEMGAKVNSPGSEAPGISYTGGDPTTLLDQLKNEKDLKKKSEMIFELKTKNPKLYNQL